MIIIMNTSYLNYKNEFDILFLDNVSKAKNDLNKCINLLTEGPYNELYAKKDNYVLCHLDLAHHNFIIEDNEINIIDFDYCKLGIKVLDIYNYIVKVIKNYAYNKDILVKIINDYNEIFEISVKEKKVVSALLNYPRDFINISMDYYLKQKSWDEEVFISRFRDKIENDIFRTELLRCLNENLE